MYKFFLLSLLAVALGQGTSGDVEKVRRQISGTDPPATGSGTDAVPEDNSCLSNKIKGICVRYYLCDHVDVGHDVSDRNCPSYLDVCCQPSHVLTLEDLNINRTTTNREEQLPSSSPDRSGCGWRNTDGAGFSFGDTNGEANYGEFPWVVVIYSPFGVVKDGREHFHYKGVGTLIHPSVVLAAAHIIKNDEERLLRVRAGDWDLQTIKELYPHQDRDVESRVIHKDFNNGSLFHDIALLFLSKPVELAPNVGIVCLPLPSESVATDTQCILSWWPKEPTRSGILNKVEVPVVDRNSCQNGLRTTQLGQKYELHTSFMCTRNGSCSDGAGGAPLVCPMDFQDGRFMQSGIAAWDVGCERNMVFVDVANLRVWIDDEVKRKGYSTLEYA